MEPHELLQGQDWAVQFDQAVNIPTTDIALLLRKKTIQLDDRAPVKFKIKLGVTFLRINNEELAAGLENPWVEPAQQKPARPEPATAPQQVAQNPPQEAAPQERPNPPQVPPQQAQQ